MTMLHVDRDAAADPALFPDEPSLDPVNDSEWDAMRVLGTRMVGDMLGFLRGMREEPAWRPTPGSVRERLTSGPPMQGEGADRAYADFLELVLPYRVGNVHPRFWGRVQGTGTVVGMFAELLSGAMNNNSSGLASAASDVETQVLSWCRTLLGYPESASGILVSGGSMANFVGLTVAREAAAQRAGVNVKRDGVSAFPCPPVVYASAEVHNSVDRAMMLLGFGTGSLRRIPVDGDFRIRVDLLERAIVDDRAAGRLPMAIVGNAGTVNTGATDDLDALSNVAARQGLWLHVDGAFGAWAALAPSLAPRLSGLARADSVAFDLHKWMYMPYDVGAVLVRDPAVHRAAFTVGSAGYIGAAARGVEADEYRFNELGPQLSRAFRALKVWLSIKSYGVEAFRTQIERNVAQASYLAQRVEAHPSLELLAPVPLNVVCFRYNPTDNRAVDLDALNREILMTLHERGIAVPTSTRVRGVSGLRCAITNHRSSQADFDVLVESVAAIGRELSGGRARESSPGVAS